MVPRDERPAADAVIDLVLAGRRAVDARCPTRRGVARLGALIDEHSLRVPVCEGFSFGQIPEALSAFREHKQGKLSVV